MANYASRGSRRGVAAQGLCLCVLFVNDVTHSNEIHSLTSRLALARNQSISRPGKWNLDWNPGISYEIFKILESRTEV